MKTKTEYLIFNTEKRHEFLNISDKVQDVVTESGVTDGLVLVNAMHITASVYINDAESGLIHDFENWLMNFGDDFDDLRKRIRDICPYFTPLTELRRRLAEGFRTYFQDVNE